MKRIISIILLTCTLFTLMCGAMSVNAANNDEVKVVLKNYVDKNGKWQASKAIKFKKGEEPKIINNRTMLPIRAVAEELGYNVNWNEYTKQVSIDVTLPDDTSKTEQFLQSKGQYNALAWMLYRLENGERMGKFKKDTYGFYFPDKKELGKSTMSEDVYDGYPKLDTILYGNLNTETASTDDGRPGFTSLGCVLEIDAPYAQTGAYWFYATIGFGKTYLYNLDSPATLIKTKNADGKQIWKTYVPLRAVGEMLGLKVDWNNNTRTATISVP